MANNTKKTGSIIVVDDNKAILAALQLLLEQHFARVVLVSNPNVLDTVVKREDPDVVLLDMNFTAGINTGNEGLFWLGRVKQNSPDTEVVLFTAYGDIDLAVRGIKKGAFDFIVKPWDNEKLVATLANACKMGRSRRSGRAPGNDSRTVSNEPEMFWGTSDAMMRLRETVEKVAATDANVLITGENGTGKEMLAREIHRMSQRSKRSWVGVDMGALPETLFESELFGHVKGAFTDARADRVGKFEAAHGGTLFLDEIANVPCHLQAKLLTAIQGRRIQRVGSNEGIDVDVRLLSATNRDLNEMVAGGTFREDLLYRINTLHLEIPPLRERREDIVPLAQMFLRRYAAKYGKAVEGFEPELEGELTEYPWNGNIRQLQHTMEKAVILSSGQRTLSPGALSLHSDRRPAPTQSISTLEEMEKQMIGQAIDRCKGNLTAVAQQLGITRQTLYNKIKRYGL